VLFFLLVGKMPAGDMVGPASGEPRVTSHEAEILRQIDTLAETDIQAAIGQLRMNLVAESNPAMLYALGVLHVRNDQLPMAEVIFAEVVARQPGFMRARRNLASVLTAQGKSDAALREWRRILDLAPDLVDARVALGAVLYDSGALDAAVAEMQRALASDPGNVRARLVLAGVYMTRQAWADAEGQLAAVVKQCPDDVQVRRNLSAALLEQQKWSDAVFHMKELLAGDATASDVRQNLIYALVQQGRNDEAEKQVLVLAHDPAGDLQSVSLLVQAWLDEGRRDQAKALLRDVLALRPSAGELRERLAGLLLNEGEMAGALGELQALLALEPGRLSARRMLVDALLQNKAGEAVVPELMRLLDEPVPDKARLWACLGDVHRQLEQYAAAADAYRRSLAYDPGGTAVRLALIRSVLDQGDLEQAAQLVRNDLSREPTQGEFWRLLVHISLRRPECADALAWLVCAREFGCADSESLLTQGDLLLRDGLYVDALQCYRDAASMDGVSVGRLLRAVDGFMALGSLSEATALVEVLSRHGGEWTAADRRHLRLATARLAAMDGHDDAALAVYREILRDAPLDGAVLMAIGDHLRDRHVFGEALEYYECVARVSVEQKPLALVRQAQIAVEQREYERAATLLEQSLALRQQGHVARYLAQVRRLIE